MDTNLQLTSWMTLEFVKYSLHNTCFGCWEEFLWVSQNYQEEGQFLSNNLSSNIKEYLGIFNANKKRQGQSRFWNRDLLGPCQTHFSIAYSLCWLSSLPSLTFMLSLLQVYRPRPCLWLLSHWPSYMSPFL